MKVTSDQIPMCCNCKRARPVPLSNDVLCQLSGVVAEDYLCKKYEYNIFLKRPKRKRGLNVDDYSEEDFAIIDKAE